VPGRAGSELRAPRRRRPRYSSDSNNLREKNNISGGNIGINAMLRASHRQDYLAPPRRHRSFPPVELLS
jgi:hypothetical protein